MRKYTKKLLDLIDEGIVDKDTLILNLLNWMSEDFVKEFYEQYYESEEDEDDSEDAIEMNRIEIAFQLGKTYSLPKSEFFCGVT